MQNLLEKEELEEAMASLTERERNVIKLRFGLDDGKTRTLEEVGKEFNVTRERIRQIEAKALRKLRHPSRSRIYGERRDSSSMKSPNWLSSSSPIGVSKDTGSLDVFKISSILATGIFIFFAISSLVIFLCLQQKRKYFLHSVSKREMSRRESSLLRQTSDL